MDNKLIGGDLKEKHIYIFKNIFLHFFKKMESKLQKMHYKQRKQKRQMKRNYMRKKSNNGNNDDTLKRIKNLPRQITNDPFQIQLFNGSHFY